MNRDFIRDALEDQAEDLARQAWGDLQRSGRGFRSKDSDALSLFPGDDGQWRWWDFRAGAGGDLFDFVAVNHLGLDKAASDFPAVLKASAAICGISPDASIDPAARERLAARKKEQRDRAEQLARAKREADQTTILSVQSAGQALQGTPGAIYLEGRGIHRLPDDAVFLPGGAVQPEPGLYGAAEASLPPFFNQPSIAFRLRDRAGRVTGLQRVVIRPDGSGKAAPFKPSLGEIKGAFVRFPGDGSPCIAEGPETGLSIWQATGRETWVSCGGFGGLDPSSLEPGEAVTLCRDADKPGSPADAALFKAAMSLHDAGVKVWIAAPPELAGSKRDFNDTLQSGGEDAVRAAIEAAEPFAPSPPDAPYYPKPEADHETGPELHRAAVEAWGRDTSAFLDGEASEPPRRMISGAQGVGKTRAVIEALREQRGRVSRFHLPTLEKCDEAAKDLQRDRLDHDPRVMVVRGRDAAGPSGEAMCGMHGVARKLSAAGVNVRKTLCPKCPLKDQCAYLGQEDEIRDVCSDPRGATLVSSHGYLTAKLPGGAKAELVVVDERPSDFLTRRSDIPLRELGKNMRPSSQSPDKMADAFAALMEAKPTIVAIQRAIEEAPGRELGYLAGQGFTAETYRKARDVFSDFIDRRMTDRIEQAAAAHEASPQASSAADLERRLEAVLSDGVERNALRHRDLCAVAMREMESGNEGFAAIWPGERVGKTDGDEKVVEPSLFFAWVQSPNIEDNAPFLYLDGTGDPDIASAMFGSLAAVHIPVERNAHIVQVVGKSFSNQSIKGTRSGGTPFQGKWAEEAKRLRQDIGAAVARSPRPFVAGNKGVIAALKEHLPDDAETGHFNALRGLNRAEHCETAYVIGREMPPPEGIERQARAVAAKLGRPFQSLGGAPWATDRRKIRTRDGSEHWLGVECHPDLTADTLLRQIREAEIAQALDRVRPIFNRRKLILLAPVVCDLTVDRVMTWADFKKGGARLERVAASGVLPLSPSELKRCFPGMWGDNAEKIRKNFQRDTETRDTLADIERAGFNLGDICQIESLFGNCPPNSDGELKPDFPVVLVQYRRAKGTGRGRPPAPTLALVFTPAESAQKKLLEIVGPVDEFTILEAIAPPALTDEEEERAAIIEANGVDRRIAEKRAVTPPCAIAARSPLADKPPLHHDPPRRIA
ncbi:MAG: toprim domain-containing protein [Pseudomonadota bacterium]